MDEETVKLLAISYIVGFAVMWNFIEWVSTYTASFNDRLFCSILWPFSTFVFIYYYFRD